MLKPKLKRKVFKQVIKDIEGLSDTVRALAKAAQGDVDAKRSVDAIRKLVEMEPMLHNALGLIDTATYTNRLGEDKELRR